jgi:hypothetical protein
MISTKDATFGNAQAGLNSLLQAMAGLNAKDMV